VAVGAVRCHRNRPAGPDTDPGRADRRVRSVAPGGTDHSRPTILGSPLAAAVQDLEPGVGILSNEPVELLWVTQRLPIIGSAAFSEPRIVDEVGSSLALIFERPVARTTPDLVGTAGAQAGQQ
jgi:hypothetical protein